MNASSDDKYPGQQSTTLSIGSNHSDASQLAVLNYEEAQPEGVPTVAIEDEKKEEPVTWRSLPHRSQLIVLTLARLSEPLVGTSLQVNPALLSITAKVLLIHDGAVLYVLPTQIFRWNPRRLHRCYAGRSDCQRVYRLPIPYCDVMGQSRRFRERRAEICYNDWIDRNE